MKLGLGLVAILIAIALVGPFITAWCVNTVVHPYMPSAPSMNWWQGLAFGLLLYSLRGSSVSSSK